MCGIPEAKDVSSCLWEFSKLRLKADADILQFATKWGVLGLWPTRQVAEEGDFCQRVPFATPSSQRNEDLRAFIKPLKLKSPGWEPTPIETDYWICETVQFWRRLSTHFWSILQCAAALYSGKVPETEWWEGMTDNPIDVGRPLPAWWGGVAPGGQSYDDYAKEPFIGPGYKSSIVLTRENWEIEQLWKELLRVIFRWTNQTWVQLLPERTINGIAVRLSVNDWNKNWGFGWTPEMYQRCARENRQELPFQNNDTYPRGRSLPMRSSVLLNILVIQLMASVASPIYRCAICGEAYNPERKPRSDKALLCQNEECKSEQGRKRSKKQAENKAAKKRL